MDVSKCIDKTQSLRVGTASNKPTIKSGLNRLPAIRIANNRSLSTQRIEAILTIRFEFADQAADSHLHLRRDIHLRPGQYSTPE